MWGYIHGAVWRWTMLAVLGIFMYLLGIAGAEIYPLVSTMPSLSIQAGALDWTGGGPAYALVNRGLVRVNVRGVFLGKRGAVLRGLEELGWSRNACNVSAYALCSTSAGDVFPSFKPRVAERLDQVRSGWLAGQACAPSTQKVLVARPVYDVSACDVLQNGLDVVYANGHVFQLRTEMSLPVYWAVMLLSVYLMRSFSYNLQVVRRGVDGQRGRPRVRQLQVLVASLCLLLLVVIQSDGVYVTEEDYMHYVLTLLYVGVYLCCHMWGWREETPVYNIIAGTLQLVVSRLYTGCQSPYNQVILVMIATRTWVKLKRQTHLWTTIMDACYLAVLCHVGFLPDPSYLVAVFLAAWALSDGLM